MSFSCPLCHAPLTRAEKTFICPQGHQFDRAKEGYVNLLPVQHKRSRDPGDSAEMMQARRAFLDAGHYQPLRDAVVALLRQYLTEGASAMLDIGCGEGYYTATFADVAAEKGAETFGLDVSKVAIRAAAKRYSAVTFCVASSHRLPFEEASMDAVVRIYAPCKAEELARVRDAQWARGAAFSEGGLRARLGAWQTVFVPLFVGLFRRADALAVAMDARCYGTSDVPRTSLARRRLTAGDVCVLVAGLAACAALAAWL